MTTEVLKRIQIGGMIQMRAMNVPEHREIAGVYVDLVMKMMEGTYCKYCGVILEKRDRYCPECGSLVMSIL